MRIAVVETAAQGGLLHYAIQMADGLADRGHDVDVLVPSGHELVDYPGAARRREVLTAPSRLDRPLPKSPPGVLLRRARIALRLVRTWSRVGWEVRRGGYDAVIITADVALTLVAAMATVIVRLPGGPVFADVCHNVRTYNRWGGDDLYASSPVMLRVLRMLFSSFDMIFVHGERSRQMYLDSYPPARIAVVPHGDEGVFASEPPPPSAEERVLFFGDWRKVKGLPVLMEAFDLLAARRPTARLTIAGTPSPIDGDPDAVRAWAAGHGDAVTIIDQYVPVEAVSDVFAAARVVVTPYLAASQSGVAHLAMTMARAVVASDVGDLRDVVRDGKTGRLVPVGDPEALADGLEELIADPVMAERMGAEGRRVVLSETGWDKAAEAAEAALEQVVR
jgi:glycosyltransferase involved in cell wall biosynthesis